MRKLISSTSFVLKGTGWYATDYASQKKSVEGKENKKKTETKTGEAGTETKSDPAPESKPEASKEEVAAK